MVLVIKNRNEIHVLKDFQKLRKRVIDHPESLEEVVSLSNSHSRYGRKSVINSDFFGGIALLFLMLALFVNQDGSSDINYLATLALVFSVRFSILYAAEFSRHAGRILQQRVIIDKVTNEKFL